MTAGNCTNCDELIDVDDMQERCPFCGGHLNFVPLESTTERSVEESEQTGRKITMSSNHQLSCKPVFLIGIVAEEPNLLLQGLRRFQDVGIFKSNLTCQV